MKVITMPRKTGRTTELILECAKYPYALIVATDYNRAKGIKDMANKMGVKIPNPITWNEYAKGQFFGRNVNCFFIDDLDAVLRRYSKGVPIKAVVISGDEE